MPARENASTGKLMSAPDLSLLATRRFGPLFIVQFLGAFNDNVLKFAMLFLANFSIYATAPEKSEQLALLSTGLFILPYFMFSALAGQLADAVDKTKLVRAVKAAEAGIMALGLVGFWIESIPVLLGALFLMGCHSALFGPVKYSIMPQHLGAHEVMGGTGVIEAGTFLAILGGQLLAGFLPPWEAGLCATVLAIVGLIAAFAMPPAPPAAPGLPIELNIFKGTWAVMTLARGGRGQWLAILGISWLFAVGAVLVAQFAPLISGTLDAGKHVVTLFLLVFSVMIAIGSMAVNRLLKGEISARYVPAAALGMGISLIALWLLTAHFTPQTPHADIAAFMATPGALPILVALAVMAFCGGMFIVPLYALLQTLSPPEARSRVIAANNIVNAIVTVAVVAVNAGLLAMGSGIPGAIGVLGFATIAVALLSRRLLVDANAAA
jgi:acyl-[acyl-carrier-protein]-phospholipid O-acyltransferase / long-chain-fatty-acid--[acyl-carrier-protein] ligase